MVQPTVQEARARRRICQRLAEVFARWGFAEIEVPLLQPAEDLEPVAGPQLMESSYKVIDHQGRVLCLRPDFTAAISSMVTGQWACEPRPLRLSYFGSVFRRGTSGMRETPQAGVENIGSPHGDPDAECIAVALEGLQAVGVREVHVALGDAGVLRAWLDQAGLTPDTLRRTVQALSGKDLVSLERLLGAAGGGLARSFQDLLDTRGDGDALDRALKAWQGSLLEPHLEALRLTYGRLGAMGLCESVFVDLGLLRDLDYYTGLVFDVYIRGLGEPVAGGGRYDDLLGRIGAAEAAVGFADNVEAISKISTEGALSGFSLSIH
jgi:ATP phosphoribosyltransferase regulatory subunit